MLSCRDITARASAILDGELPAKERFGVRLHLLVCVHCRRFLRQWRALNGALRLRGRQQEDSGDEALQAHLLAVLTAMPAATAIARPAPTAEHPPPPEPPPDSRP